MWIPGIGSRMRAMIPAAFRALFVLVAVLGALAAPDAGRSRVDVARAQGETTACAADSLGTDEDSAWLRLAVLGEPGPAALTEAERPGRGASGSGDEPEPMPRPTRADRPVDPRRRGALAPGERPEAQAFQRRNGCANAGGAGT